MKAKAVRLVTALTVLAVLARTAGAVQIVVGPYLQTPTETSMTVMWVTDQSCTSWVEFGQEDTLDRKAHHSRHGLIEADQTIHRIKLQGLAPGTADRYRVGSKEIVKFEPYKVTYGDTVYSDAHTFTTLNGKKEGIEILASLMKLAEPKPYDLVFLNGDILGHIENQQQVIDHVLAPCTKLFASQTPFVYVRGNHETRGRFARRLPDYLTLPNDRYYYSFDHGPVHFVILDGGEDKQDTAEVYAGLVDFDHYRDVQQKWLRLEIQSAAFKQAPFRVVLVHMPPKPSEQWHGPDDLYNKWRPVLNGEKVDLMVCGHTHRYTVEMPEKGVRDYPRVIGGGPQAGEATLIRIDATVQELDVTMTRDDGHVVGTCRIKRDRKP